MEKKLPNEIKLNLRDFLDEIQLESFYKSLREYLEEQYPNERCCGFDTSAITLTNVNWCEKEITYEVCDGNYIIADFDTLEKAKAYLKQYGASEIIKETEYHDAKGNHYDIDYIKIYEKEWK